MCGAPLPVVQRLHSKLPEACLSVECWIGALWLSQEVGVWAVIFPAISPSVQKPNCFTITGSHPC